MRPSFLTKIYKPVIGMVNLAALPGSVHYRESFPMVLERAVDQAKVLVEAGFDALLLRNTGDIPASETGDEATVAFMTAAGLKLREVCPVPLGIEVLMNGSKAALAIARASGAEFVRIRTCVAAGALSADAAVADLHEVLAFRRRIEAGGVILLGDLFDCSGVPLGALSLPVLADLTLRQASADALVASGGCEEETLARLDLLRKSMPSTLLVSDVNAAPGTLEKVMRLSNAVIMGSSFKTGVNWLEPVDPQKAQQFMDGVRSIREKLKLEQAKTD